MQMQAMGRNTGNRTHSKAQDTPQDIPSITLTLYLVLVNATR